MSGLLGTMSIAMGALEAQQAGLETTSNNIANLNTPGYTRERPVLQETDPIIVGGIAYGDGVKLQSIESLRDSILQLQISNETQQQGQTQAYVSAMSQAQMLFPDDTSGIGQQISNFFQSLNGLSTDPSNLALRQSVLSAANGMASAVNGAANQLSAQRTALDQNVEQTVAEVNLVTQEIANLNTQIAKLSSTAQEYGSFVDQRDNLVQKLSGLMDVSVINDGTSITLTTKQGAPLVSDGQSLALSTALDPASGVQRVYSQGTDITEKISSGELGGLLQARDQTLPAMQTQLDSLASGLVQALNTAHAQGFDLNGNAGGNLFTPVSGAGAAASMAVAITNPTLLAASSDGTTGSNGNLANLSAVANQAVSNGMTPTQAYGNLVFQAGSAVSDGTTELNASNTMLQQLQQQQASVSGVSLDEEASNLLLYQRAYQAAAQAISAVDQMLQTAIQMGGAKHMRISPYITQIELNAISAADQAEQTALLQMTTGKRVNVSSDDPSAAAREVAISSQSSDCDQFLRSISSISSELQTADSALNSGVTALQRAITLGTEGANGTMSQDDRAELASEVQSISQQMMGVANLSYNGKYIFAGTADSQPPYIAVAGGIVYQGNDSVNQVEIEPGQTIAVNQPGSQLFSAAGASVFQALSDLTTALQSSSSTSDDIANATNEVSAAYNQLNSARTFYGSTLDQINASQDFLNSEKLQLTQQTSDLVGVDINQAATNLANAETARNAALQAAASVGNLSLFDYLGSRGR